MAATVVDWLERVADDAEAAAALAALIQAEGDVHPDVTLAPSARTSEGNARWLPFVLPDLTTQDRPLRA
ncbi:hypothetical protein ACFXJ8_24325 [Nonomuraea sp. NPDC059194]|uniref:hypothetical protein n=1 Tax=Nonomuraea sp. NPDC059194 TaxID=3346764 RepID=UPI00367B9B14